MKIRRDDASRGFALVVTLSLMILLAVLAIGLLSLSTISLRTAGHGGATATAQSNARLALMLAIGELQKAAGPDTRITAPANLVDPGAPSGITGVWNSWKPKEDDQDYQAAKSDSNFHGYLMSNPDPDTLPDPKSVPTGSSNATPLVGAGSIGTGNAGGEINAPSIGLAGKQTGTPSGEIAWVTLDEGVKSRIDLAPAVEASTQADRITQVGSPARNGFEDLTDMDFLNGENDSLALTLPKLVSLNQAALESSNDAIARYFHDFTVSSSLVQADVVEGGLKTDLSVLFDGTYGSTLPSDYNNRFLYSDSTKPYQDANSDIQWGLYANYSRLYRRTTPGDNPKDGIKAALATPPTSYRLSQILDRTARRTRYEPDMKNIKQPVLMPTVVRVDTVFSLVVRDAHHGWVHPTYNYLLHLLYLPVITLHNPYNVPLRTTNLQVEFSDIPIGFEFLINGQPATTRGLTSLNDFYVNAGGGTKSFSMVLANELTGSSPAATEVVMGPGETRIFGTPFLPTMSWASELAHNGSKAAGAKFFDWQNTLTTGTRTIPGLIAGPNDGVGFDVDWLAPSPQSQAHIARAGSRGVINVRMDDDIKVRFGPKTPASAASTSTFSVTVKLGSVTSGQTQVFYLNNSRLTEVMEEGTSPRFPDKRSFPETVPGASSSPIRASQLYEPNGRPLKDYRNAKPFAIFSVGAKTTEEAFTLSRPLTDTGMAFQMATCDFTSAATQGASPLEFALVPKKDGRAFMDVGGPDNEHAYFFGGHGSFSGTTSATLYEIPMAPLQSIAQLRHANGGSIGSVPYVTYTVGESRAHPAVPSGSTFVKPDVSRTVLDHSWLANDRLWDSYWFSTLATLQGVAYPQSTTLDEHASQFFTGETDLPNARNVAWLPPGKPVDDVAGDAITPDGKRSAAYILTKGGFNVNSTSVPAWISLLSALVDSDVAIAMAADGSGPGVDADPSGTPFPRVRQPSGGLDGTLAAREQLWNSYRTLENSEIEKLAELIVEEVRERGPFLSMAEFVNRRLSGPGELSISGAIQAAIDRSNINEIMESNAKPIDPADVGEYGWLNASAVKENTGAGAPGEVSQGDVLSAIGSFISVRSDTFRIRAYGDARDAQGKVIAQAWCEATVQRVPEYVDSADLPHEAANSQTNLDFGRRFQVVSFRWLRQSEI